MHIIKCGKSDYSKLKGEACRDDGYHSRLGTIKQELTKHNYKLIDKEPPTDIDEHIKSLGVDRKIRPNAVRCLSVIVDYPKDETKSPADFFTDAMKGLQEYFNIKDDAILYAQVHVDEGHEHMHFAFVPLVESEKTYKDGHTKNQVKLSAYEILTKQKLQELHPYIQKYMEERDYKGTLYYGDNERRDRDFLEHKFEQVEKDLNKKESQLNFLEDVPEEKAIHIGSDRYIVDGVTLHRASVTKKALDSTQGLEFRKKQLDKRERGLDKRELELDERERGMDEEYAKKYAKKFNEEMEKLKKASSKDDIEKRYENAKRDSLLERYQKAFPQEELEKRERSRSRDKNIHKNNDER